MIYCINIQSLTQTNVFLTPVLRAHLPGPNVLVHLHLQSCRCDASPAHQREWSRINHHTELNGERTLLICRLERAQFGVVCVIRNKSRLDPVLTWACEVTERFQPCAGYMTLRQGRWLADIHTTAFKRWRGQQRPYVWMTAPPSWRARRPTSCLL